MVADTFAVAEDVVLEFVAAAAVAAWVSTFLCCSWQTPSAKPAVIRDRSVRPAQTKKCSLMTAVSVTLLSVQPFTPCYYFSLAAKRLLLNMHMTHWPMHKIKRVLTFIFQYLVVF